MTITDKIDNITLIDEAHYGTTIAAPRSVKIELTGRCNFRCSYCARSMRLREQQDMDFEFYRTVVRDMHDSGVEELGLFYLGESFLYPKLVEAIQYAKEIGFKYVFLTTNGSIAEPEKVETCMKAGLDSLKFSLNYADDKQFEEIARVKGRMFYRMLNNLYSARDIRNKIQEKTGHRCGLYASYIAYDGEQKTRMQALLNKIEPYVDEIYALPLYNQASFVQSVIDELGYIPVAGNLGRLDRLREPLPCWACFTEGHITWDGRLSACCFDHDGRFDMGNLKRNTFMECWNSERFVALREAHLKKDVCNTVCEKCVVWS